VKEIFIDLLAQNILSNSFSLNMINKENISNKLNEKTSSVGFIYRHIGETMLLFGYFFGMPYYFLIKILSNSHLVFLLLSFT